MKILWMILLTSFLLGSVAQARSTLYSGDFQFSEDMPEPCKSLFNDGEFTLKHFIVGPSNTTSVLYFESVEEGRENVFFDERRFVGRKDAADRVYYEEQFDRDGYSYQFVVRGFIAREVTILDVYVEAFDMETKTALCEGDVEFTGFRQ